MFDSWIVACQAPLSIGFPKQEYWSGLPFPSPGDLSNPGIEPASPALQADSLPLSHHWTHWGREAGLKACCMEASPSLGRGDHHNSYLCCSHHPSGPQSQETPQEPRSHHPAPCSPEAEGAADHLPLGCLHSMLKGSSLPLTWAFPPSFLIGQGTPAHTSSPKSNLPWRPPPADLAASTTPTTALPSPCPPAWCWTRACCLSEFSGDWAATPKTLLGF